jgi:ElaB/YqjD/DUF883 family membrane-anchored ribosome-binding protein
MNTHYSRPGSGAASNATNAMNDLAYAAQDKISDTVDQAQALAQDQYDKLLVSIRRNPLQAAGIAAGIGFALALLARR